MVRYLWLRPLRWNDYDEEGIKQKAKCKDFGLRFNFSSTYNRFSLHFPLTFILSDKIWEIQRGNIYSSTMNFYIHYGGSSCDCKASFTLCRNILLRPNDLHVLLKKSCSTTAGPAE